MVGNDDCSNRRWSASLPLHHVADLVGYDAFATVGQGEAFIPPTADEAARRTISDVLNEVSGFIDNLDENDNGNFLGGREDVRGGLAPAGGAAKLSPLTASNTFQTSRHRSPQVIHNAEASDEYYDDNDDEAVSSSEHLYTSLSGRYRISNV